MKNALDLLDQIIVQTVSTQEKTFLRALRNIAEHVERELDGDPDAPINGGNLVEAVAPALRACGLWPAPRAEWPWRRLCLAAQAGVAKGERMLVAFNVTGDVSGPPLVIVDGEALGVPTRAGAVLARLLATGGQGDWHLVAVRPGGAPQKKEIEAAERILAAGRLVDLPVQTVSIVTTRQSYLLGERGGES